MSLQRCKRETTSTEFLKWQTYFEQDLNTHKREDYYLAQIAAEIRRVMRKSPSSIKLEHFLLKFQGEVNKNKPLTDKDIKRRTEWSKTRWMTLVMRTKPRKPPRTE